MLSALQPVRFELNPLHPQLPSFRARPAPDLPPQHRPSPSSVRLRPGHPPPALIDLLPRLLLVIALLVVSLIVISISISTVPSLRLPTSLDSIKAELIDLKRYVHQPYSLQFFHLTSILTLIFIWKQAFSIPGTILLNILIGAIYGTWFATLLTCFLTGIGSTLAYLIASSLLRPMVIRFLPKSLNFVERSIERFKLPGSSDRYDTIELSSYLLLARFLPIVPYAGLNLASGVLRLPLLPFFWTLVIGSLPYNLVTTQVGDILSQAAQSKLSNGHPDLSTIWSTTLLFKLTIVSLMGALPVVFKDRLRSSIQKLLASLDTRSRSLSASHQQLLLPRQNRLHEKLQSSSSYTRPLFNHHHHHHHHHLYHPQNREWVSNDGLGRKSCEYTPERPSPLSILIHASSPSSSSSLVNLVLQHPPPSSSHLDHPHPHPHPDESCDDFSRSDSSSSLSTTSHDDDGTSAMGGFEDQPTSLESLITPNPLPSLTSKSKQPTSIHRPSTLDQLDLISIKANGSTFKSSSQTHHPLLSADHHPRFSNLNSHEQPNLLIRPSETFDLPRRKVARIVSSNQLPY